MRFQLINHPTTSQSHQQNPTTLTKFNLQIILQKKKNLNQN